MNKVTIAIHKLLATTWKGRVLFDINNGECEDFARDVLEIVPQAKEVWSEMFSMELVGHVWVEYRGKHYDAECPDGVRDWHDLFIFIRSKNESNAVQIERGEG